MNEFLPEITITGEQIKAARTMLRMDQRAFAELCHVSVNMIRRMERTIGPVSGDVAILKALQHSLENHGVELIAAGYYEGFGGPGVRMKGEPAMEENVVDLQQKAETGIAKQPGNRVSKVS